MPKKRVIRLVCLALLLGCEGLFDSEPEPEPDPDPPPLENRIAIAIGESSGYVRVGLFNGRKTKAQAEAEALRWCGSGCTIRVSTGMGQHDGCVAVAGNRQGAWSMGLGESENSAISDAVGRCSQGGTEPCVALDSECSR